MGQLNFIMGIAQFTPRYVFQIWNGEKAHALQVHYLEIFDPCNCKFHTAGPWRAQSMLQCQFDV